MAGRTFSFVLFLLRKKYYLQIKRCHKPENACGTLSLKTTVEPFYLLSCEAKTNSKQWECKQWQYITRSPWKVAQDCLVCSDGGALALVVSLALMMEGKHIIHIWKMYISIISWEMKGIYYINVQCPNDKAPETWPVETRLFLLFPKDLLDADAAGLAVSSGLDSQLWFVWKCTKKTN